MYGLYYVMLCYVMLILMRDADRYTLSHFPLVIIYSDDIRTMYRVHDAILILI